MIFNLYPRVMIKLGEERHVFDRASLMFTEVQEIEKVTGLSYGEWEQEIGRYSITAIAALLHVLRKRAGQSSDYTRMQFAASDLDVVPVHDDDREYTPDEVAADLERRVKEAREGPGPTPAAGGAAAAGQTSAASTSPSSPNGSGSGHGNGTGSPTPTSSAAKPTSTAS